MFGLKFNPFKSLTIGGALLGIGTTLVAHFDPSALSPGILLGLQGLGALVATIGARNAVAKAVIATLEALAAKAGR
jgi:hypothetical protein